MTDPNAETRFINPPGLPTPVGYSHVAATSGGKTVYVSGQVALDNNRNLIGMNDLGAQTQQVFKNLQTALNAAGADFNHVVKLGFYLTDMSQMQVVREVRDQFLNTQNPPASTAVQVSGLVNKDWLIEVDAVAVLPE